MPIVLNGSTGITANNLGVETIVDSAGTGGPSLPNNIVEMNFVDVLGDITNLQTNKLDKDQNIVLGTSVVASGTAVDFVGIPEGVKRITVMFDGVSTDRASNIVLQLGQIVVDATGYSGQFKAITNPNVISIGMQPSTAVVLHSTVNTGSFISGLFYIEKMGGDMFLITGRSAHSLTDTYNRVCSTVARKQLSGTLGMLRITTQDGAGVFDAGTINISWEF